MDRIRQDLGYPRVRNQRGRRPLRLCRNGDREATHPSGWRPQHPNPRDRSRGAQRHGLCRGAGRHERVQFLRTVRRRADCRASHHHRRHRLGLVPGSGSAPRPRARQARSVIAPPNHPELVHLDLLGCRLRTGKWRPPRRGDSRSVAQPQVHRTPWSRLMGTIESGRPIALVTGANRGLGLETSNQLRAKGFRVILTNRDEEKGAAAIRGLDPNGRDVGYHQLDITDAASISAGEKDIPGLVARLDLLVNNAGIGSWGADRLASARTIATNYFGSRDVTDALLPFIPDAGRAGMVSSGLGELSYLGRDLRPRFEDPSLTRPALDSLVNSYLSDLEKGEAKSAGWPSAYSVSKVAMNALTRILARALAPRKIRVNSVCPGWVRTDMGGPGANRSVEVGARSIVLGAMLPDDATGGFYRDGKRIPF